MHRKVSNMRGRRPLTKSETSICTVISKQKFKCTNKSQLADPARQTTMPVDDPTCQRSAHSIEIY